MTPSTTASDLSTVSRIDFTSLDGETINGATVDVEVLVDAIRQRLSMAHREHGAGFSPVPIPVKTAFKTALRVVTRFAPAWATDLRAVESSDISEFSTGGGFHRQITNSWRDHKQFIASFLETCLDTVRGQSSDRNEARTAPDQPSVPDSTEALKLDLTSSKSHTADQTRMQRSTY